MTSTPLPIYQPAIVPALQRIQAEQGYLQRQAVERFAKETGTPLYRLQAVASFFPHFHLEPPPRVTLRICRDMACHLAGADQVLQKLGELAGEQVRIEGVSCLGRCDRAPAACFAVRQASGGNGNGAEHDHDEERYFLGRSADDLARIAKSCIEGKGLRPKEDHDADLPYAAANWAIDPYKGAPGAYDAVKKAVAARRQSPDGWADALLAELDAAKADLRGMGGAGTPATQKWRDVRDAVRTARRRRTGDERAFIVVNGDESEPGTFKDRELLLRFPHLVVEAVILAGLVTEASQGFIYIRHEYGQQIEACRREIARAEALGMCGANASVLGRPFPISVFVSPGGYICGEQSALIEAMSDRRAEPRNLPPKLETNGLDDRPTLVSNVETFAWAPYIYLNGGEAYAKLGANGWRGKRFFSVCGDVVRPGVYEVPMGLTLRELIHGDQFCRGIAGGKKLKAFAPSGPSGGFLPARLTAKSGLPRKHTERKEWIELAERRGFDPAAQELDILDLELELNLFRALSPTQALGAGLVVYAEGRDMAEQAVNAMQFFRNESCGKCVPCRLGSQKLAALGQNLLDGKVSAQTWETLKPMIGELGEAMVLASICGLGRSVPVPLRTVMEFFPADLAGHIGITPSPGTPGEGGGGGGGSANLKSEISNSKSAREARP
jgi:NADH:ubiquinone oxidoreductase subunit F (NADH-binding)/NADH:ubiquinone oxidoreductase subunit E